MHFDKWTGLQSMKWDGLLGAVASLSGKRMHKVFQESFKDLKAAGPVEDVYEQGMVA